MGKTKITVFYKDYFYLFENSRQKAPNLFLYINILLLIEVETRFFPSPLVSVKSTVKPLFRVPDVLYTLDVPVLRLIGETQRLRYFNHALPFLIDTFLLETGAHDKILQLEGWKLSPKSTGPGTVVFIIKVEVKIKNRPTRPPVYGQVRVEILQSSMGVHFHGYE